ncbi:unnamed protein product [Ostreobium quekettii]|uniref:histone acetyltransferase n=1 Tax=Ostreobium quekettii TaxID=121088 RepID=A0A8S1JC70_9CHLO|nr:unnamed protein product [Ostreobium quekettii]
MELLPPVSPQVSWRSESDFLLRKKVIDQIRAIFGQRQASALVHAGFPDFVKRLELVLYKSAASKEEYSNPVTLLDRLKTVASQLQSPRPPAAPGFPQEGGFLPPDLSTPFATRDDAAFRGTCGGQAMRSASDVFMPALDDPSFLDPSQRPMPGFLGGPELPGGVGHPHGALAGDKKARFMSMMQPEAAAKALMSSDMSEDGFVSHFGETWSTSGASSVAFAGAPDSSLLLGDPSQMWYSDELDMGPDHGMETHSGASLDSAPRTPQGGFSGVSRPAAGSRCAQIPDLPRRASCLSEYGGISMSPCMDSVNLSPRVDGVTVTPHLSPRIGEGEFLGPPHAWKQDEAAMWEVTASGQGPLAGRQDSSQQLFTGPQLCPSSSWSDPTGTCGSSIGIMNGPTLVGYNDNLRTGTTQAMRPGPVPGLNNRFAGVVPVQGPPGRDLAAEASMPGITPPLEYSGAGVMGGQQPAGTEKLGTGLQVPVSDGRAGRDSMGEEFLKSEGQMRKYTLSRIAEAKAVEPKKCKLLGDIPENAVAGCSMPGAGADGCDSKQARQVAKNSMLPPRPTHSGSPRDVTKFSFPHRAIAEGSQEGMSSNSGAKDELVHAYSCKRQACSLMCHHLRLVFDHAKTCANRKPTCGNCRWLGMLLSLHARNCHDPDCPMPCCKK